MLTMNPLSAISFFFFNDTATTEIYTLFLHDALPISNRSHHLPVEGKTADVVELESEDNEGGNEWEVPDVERSEEHTSELQSHLNLVCRLLLEKKNDILCDTYATRVNQQKRNARKNTD